MLHYYYYYYFNIIAYYYAMPGNVEEKMIIYQLLHLTTNLLSTISSRLDFH